jgi:hypothetical protein
VPERVAGNTTVVSDSLTTVEYTTVSFSSFIYNMYSGWVGEKVSVWASIKTEGVAIGDLAGP